MKNAYQLLSKILFHEILDVHKIHIGWTAFFFLAPKFGRTSKKTTLYTSYIDPWLVDENFLLPHWTPACFSRQACYKEEIWRQKEDLQIRLQSWAKKNLWSAKRHLLQRDSTKPEAGHSWTPWSDKMCWGKGCRIRSDTIFNWKKHCRIFYPLWTATEISANLSRYWRMKTIMQK